LILELGDERFRSRNAGEVKPVRDGRIIESQRDFLSGQHSSGNQTRQQNLAISFHTSEIRALGANIFKPRINANKR
jgi:hypothetical protein